MNGKQSRFGRQREDLPDRTIERPCIAAGKVSTSSAIVWHEQSVANERSVADNVGQTRWRVARGLQYRDVEGSERKSVAVIKQPVKRWTLRTSVFEFEQPIQIVPNGPVPSAEQHGGAVLFAKMFRHRE